MDQVDSELVWAINRPILYKDKILRVSVQFFLDDLRAVRQSTFHFKDRYKFISEMLPFVSM